MKRLSFLLMFVFSTSSILLAQHQIEEGVIRHSDIFSSTMQEGVFCYRIPAIVTAQNGDLIAAIDERVESSEDLRTSNNINIVVRRSSNNGKTWSKIERVVDFPHGESASDPSMIVDGKTGDIFLFYNFMDLNNEKEIYYFHVVKSTNNGKTWSKPIDITDQIAIPEWRTDFKFITSGRGIYTSDGKILHTMVNLKSGLRIFGSDDHGKSWYVIDTPINPADESKIIELSDGRWMVNSRVNRAGMRYTHISDDQGASWTTRPEPTLIDPSCNGSIVRYSSKAAGDDKDRLLFANAEDSKDRKNLSVRVSYDDGESWSEGKVIYKGAAAYSSLTVLDNGDIAVFFEKDEYTKNEVVVFSMEWLTNGKDKGTK